MERPKPVTLSRDELYRQVWQIPMQRLAAQYGVSGNGLAKICDRLDVPYPSRGYWAKREAGKPVRQLEMPTSKSDTPSQILITPTPPPIPPASPPTMRSDVRERYDAELTKAATIVVPDTLHRPHSVIAEWIAEHKRDIAAAKRDRFTAASGPKPFTPLDDRRHRILDALFKAMEKRGSKVKTEKYKGTWLEIGRERVDFTLNERIRQIREPLTPEQLKSPLNFGAKWTQRKVPTGLLVFTIKTSLGSGICHQWTDEPEKQIEQNIIDIIATISLAGPILGEQRKLAEGQERQHREAEARRREAADERRREKNRWRRFIDLSQRWKEAEIAREFIAALEGMPPPSESSFADRSHQEWLDWARSQIINYDPAANGIGPILRNLAGVTSWDYST